MLRVNYNIQFKNRKVSPIIISITWKGERIQKSIGQSIETDNWDFKKNKAKSTYKDAVNPTTPPYEWGWMSISKFEKGSKFI